MPVDVDGEDGHAPGGHRHGGQPHTTGLQAHMALGREMGKALIVVDEDEAAAVLAAYRPAQVAVVTLGQLLGRGEGGLHGCQQFAVVVHEEVQGAQQIVVGIGLAKLAQRCLEVVGAEGQVVVGGAG